MSKKKTETYNYLETNGEEIFDRLMNSFRALIADRIKRVGKDETIDFLLNNGAHLIDLIGYGFTPEEVEEKASQWVDILEAFDKDTEMLYEHAMSNVEETFEKVASTKLKS